MKYCYDLFHPRENLIFLERKTMVERENGFYRTIKNGKIHRSQLDLVKNYYWINFYYMTIIHEFGSPCT